MDFIASLPSPDELIEVAHDLDYETQKVIDRGDPREIQIQLSTVTTNLTGLMRVVAAILESQKKA